MTRALALALLLSACAASGARGREAADVMAPLMGCWSGTFENQPNILDERCFSVLDGRHVVDAHAVRPTEYSGETTYHLDASNGRIIFAYASSEGGRSNGVLTPIESGFQFPTHDFRNADGTTLRLRSTWRFDSADRFVVDSEQEVQGAWRPFMHITYVRESERTVE